MRGYRVSFDEMTRSTSAAFWKMRLAACLFNNGRSCPRGFGYWTRQPIS